MGNETPSNAPLTDEDPLHRIGDALQEITPMLDAIAPDASQADWRNSQGRIDGAVALYKGEVLPALDAFKPLAQEAELANKLALNVAWVGAELAALLYASKRTDDGQALLLRAARVAPSATATSPGVKAEFEAGQNDMAAWVGLMHGRYLQRAQEWDAGDRVLRQARSRATQPVVKAAIDKQLGGARPITSAPPLFRINGCGASIYGERDRRDDGSYVSTYCICLLFVPVWPISAYRVVERGYGSYGFMAKEPLSAFARGYRWLVGGVGLVWAIGAAFTGWLNDPQRLAHNAFVETQTQVASQDGVHAQQAWESLLLAHEYSLPFADQNIAAGEAVRLMLEAVPSPMTAARAGEVDETIRRFQAMPDAVHRDANTSLVANQILTWQSQVGHADEASTRASSRMLEALVSFAPETDAARRVPELHAELQRAVAQFAMPDWPLEAVRAWVEAGDAESMEHVGTTLAEFVEAPSLLLEAGSSVDAYLANTSAGSEPHDTVARAFEEARLMAENASRRDALNAGDAAGLTSTLRAYPRDQETIAALAELKRHAGDLAGAHALLDPLGADGRCIGAVQLSRANLLSEEGHLAEAVTSLHRYVASRLPSFQSAQRAYASAVDARTVSLETQLRSSIPPFELEERLRGVTDEAEQSAIVRAWYLEQISQDANLTQLREALEVHAGVVPSILTLAMLELRLGNELAGEEREAHLHEAERLFLAIRSEVAGLPAFHLGLGQVYHRLGRPTEGDAEIDEVVQAGDPETQLSAAYVYRDLGLRTNASALAQRVYEGGVAPFAGQAAIALSLLAVTLEDEEMWLGRADQTDDFVRTNLLQVRARRLARDGNYREAEPLFGQVAERFLRAGAHDMASLNNAAIALEQEHACSGNPAHLARAQQTMEMALRRAPENGLGAANLANLTLHVGRIAILDRFVRTRDLHLDANLSDQLLTLLLRGTRRDEVLAALAESRDMRRALELFRQAQTLSPQNASLYQVELEMLERASDEAGIVALDERFSRVTNLETNTGRERALAWARGELDAQLVAENQGLFTALGNTVESLRGGDPTTLAAALFLRGRVAEERGHVTRDVADFDAAIALFREANAASPGLGVAPSMTTALFAAALLRGASDPALSAIVEAGWRDAPMSVLALRVQADPAARAAWLRDEAVPEFRTLLEEPHPGFDTFAFAQLVGDEANMARARANITTELARRALSISERIAPWTPLGELHACAE